MNQYIIKDILGIVNKYFCDSGNFIDNENYEKITNRTFDHNFSSNINIVHLMIKNGANDWNQGLHYACLNGHIDIVNLMIEKGANDWNNGLWNACENGHIDIVNLMIEKGANNYNLGLFEMVIQTSSKY